MGEKERCPTCNHPAPGTPEAMAPLWALVRAVEEEAGNTEGRIFSSVEQIVRATVKALRERAEKAERRESLLYEAVQAWSKRAVAAETRLREDDTDGAAAVQAELDEMCTELARTKELPVEEMILLSRIITVMHDQKVPIEFLVQLDKCARISRPVLKMANVWLTEIDEADRSETIKHLTEMFDELEVEANEHRAAIRVAEQNERDAAEHAVRVAESRAVSLEDAVNALAAERDAALARVKELEDHETLAESLVSEVHDILWSEKHREENVADMARRMKKERDEALVKIKEAASRLEDLIRNAETV